MLVYFACSLIVLLGFCGLAIDVGRMEVRSLQLQNAADATAISYAAEYGSRGNSSALNTTASAELAAYAAANGIPTPTLTIANAPTSGAYVNNAAAVQITLNQSFSTIFLGLLSAKSSTIQLTRSSTAAMPPCSSFNSSLTLTNSSTISLACPLAVGTGLSVDGSSTISGQQTLVSSSANLSSVSGSVTPAPAYNWPWEQNPLFYYTLQAESGCTVANPAPITSAKTLSPGVYCGTLQVSNATVTLQKGYYILYGGINLQNATVQGGPVTMWLTTDAANQYGYGQVVFNNSHWNVDSSVVTEANGIDADLVFEYDGSTAIQITNSTIAANGIFNFPAAGATITNSVIGDGNVAASGGHSGGNYISLCIAGAATVSGSQITITDDYSLLPDRSPLAFPVTVLQ